MEMKRIREALDKGCLMIAKLLRETADEVEATRCELIATDDARLEETAYKLEAILECLPDRVEAELNTIVPQED